MNKKANYKIIYDSLKNDILNGTLTYGSMLPSEKSVADKYFLSRPTVSKAYNLLQDEGLIKKTRGFGSQVVYKSLKDIYTIGLLLPGAGESEIFSIITDQLLQLSKKGKFNCLWEGATANNAEIRSSLIESVCKLYIDKEVDGVLFSPLERFDNANIINLKVCKLFKDANIPITLIDRDIVKDPERSEFDLVSLDNFNAGKIMAKHLIDSGCTNIHFFCRPNSAYSVDLRLSGIKDIALKNKLTFNDSNVYIGDPADYDFVKKIEIESGKTGIICANDSTAAVLISTLDNIGIKISSDVLVCGYDNMKYSNQLRSPLTSYIQPCKEIANISIELIMRRIKNNRLIPIKVNLNGDIIIRESTTFK